MKKKITILLVILLTLCLTSCGSKKESNKDEYYCQEGDLRGNNCAIAVSESATDICPDDYELIGGTCYKTEIKSAQIAKTCEEGYKLNKEGDCLSTKTYEMDKEYSCELPANIVKGPIKVLENSSIISAENKAFVKNDACYITVWKDYNEALNAYYNKETKKIDFTVTASCPKDTINYKNKCYKTSTPKENYVCDIGDLHDTECHIKITTKPSKICNDDYYTYNDKTNKCERINLVQASKK